MYVENIKVEYGEGMAIGSIAPDKDHSCIRNVTFKNIEFDKPLKAIHVKTNVGDEGSGEITNIFYENLRINRPLWWAMYLGPHEP